MPENQLTLKINTDLSQLEADSKKLGSALEGAASGAIGGFEQVRSRLVAATQQVVQLRKELQTATDPAVVARLNAALGTAQQQMSLARVEMRGMSTATRQTTESANMLAAQLGIQLPAGLERLIARMPMVQAAMAAAFNVTIIGALVAGLVTLGVKGWEALEKLRGKTEELAGWLKKAADENTRLFLGFTTSEEGTKRIAELAKRSGEAEGRIAALKKQMEDLDPAAAAMAMILSSRLNKAEEEARIVTNQLNEALANQTKILQGEHKQAVKGAINDAERWRKELLDLADVMYTNWEGVLDIQKQAIDAEKAADEVIGRGRHQLAMETIEDENAVIRTMEEHGRVMDERIIKQSKDAVEATKQAAQAQQQALEATAGKIESFIDRVFLTARSLGDVFHQFLMQLLGSFVKWISHMLASWLTGIRQATAGAGGGVGGGGGWLGSLLGGVFGLGGGTSAMAATGGGTSGLTAGQLSLPISMGGMALAAGGGIPSAMGGAAQGGLGQLAFGGTSLANLATMAPLMAILGGVSLAGHGGPVTGAIGGFAAGIGATALLGALGPATFGLTWLGAGIGALIGMFRRGGQKRKSARLEQGFEFAADDVEKAYELHKLDYDSAISQLEGLIASGQQTLTSAGTGRWGRQGSENLTRVIQDLINRVNDLEKQRQATTTALAGMTIPEFAVGGVVGLSTFNSRLSTGLLAILHPGEFVMRREAVDNLGANFLAALNRAPAFGAGGAVGSQQSAVGRGRGINIENLNVYPARGMSDREAMNMVVRGFNLATREGAL